MYNYYDYQSDPYYRNTTPNIIRDEKSLYTPEEGYNKGNLFENLYEEYKNYKPIKLEARNEEESLYLELARYAFAAHELNLYLDLHPDDSSMLALFNDYRSRADQLKMEYEKKYGPLSVSSDVMQNSFTWEEDKWPWEGSEM